MSCDTKCDTLKDQHSLSGAILLEIPIEFSFDSDANP